MTPAHGSGGGGKLIYSGGDCVKGWGWNGINESGNWGDITNCVGDGGGDGTYAIFSICLATKVINADIFLLWLTPLEKDNRGGEGARE